MLTSTSSSLLRRVVIGGLSGAVAGFAIGYSLAARNPIPLLLALAGFAIGATLAQGVPEPLPERPELGRLAGLPAPADRAPAWLPDPLGGEQERLWDGTEWTPHIWRRGQKAE